MIVKFFEFNKKNLNKEKFFLFYGKNQGLIQETIEKYIKPLITSNIYNYDEGEVLKNPDNFLENVTNKSFFETKKLIIISRCSDKMFEIMENIIEKNHDDIIIILKSEILEKRSKIRNLFEKNKNTICVPFYEDNNQSLILLANNFFKEKNIQISQQNINLIIERSNGDRINLKNELNKIEQFSINKKNIDSESVLKLTNLSENYDISELIDSTLTKNQKKTIHILNESIFANDEAIIILRIFLYKLKRLLKIQNEIKTEKNIEKVFTNLKPPIFWKEKDTVKKQIKLWDYKKLVVLISRVNQIELLAKKNPNNSINLITDFILEKVAERN
tara:strand:- start:1860 stop:2852 length:993 start_codon:yes stop_codon:yes gene_type:complete